MDPGEPLWFPPGGLFLLVIRTVMRAANAGGYIKSLTIQILSGFTDRMTSSTAHFSQPSH